MSVRAYVALGSNLGDREQTLRAAVAAIGRLPGTAVTAASSVYATAPVGVDTPQPDYYNAVIGIDTALSPRDLLRALQAIERDAGRVRDRGVRNAARTLDLDILLYADRTIDEDGLRVPHPRLHERAFALAPLAEIAPHVRIPGHGPAATLLDSVAAQRIERLPIDLAADGR
jgi:2-amino-4-hydroxy-6-hydroxymethyldihydropteridine diphosphokinase